MLFRLGKTEIGSKIRKNIRSNERAAKPLQNTSNLRKSYWGNARESFRNLTGGGGEPYYNF